MCPFDENAGCLRGPGSAGTGVGGECARSAITRGSDSSVSRGCAGALSQAGASTTEIHAAIPVGLHDQLVTLALAHVLEELKRHHSYETAQLDAAEIPSAVAQHLARLMASCLAEVTGVQASDLRTRLLGVLSETVVQYFGERVA